MKARVSSDQTAFKLPGRHNQQRVAVVSWVTLVGRRGSHFCATMDPGAFVALPQCSPEALAAAAAGAADQEPAAPQEVEVAGSVCSRRVCGRVMFFELRGTEDQKAPARVQVMLQCSVCGEQLYQ